MNKPVPTHLGDGAYVSFDGYNVNLAVNHHTNHVIALEPEVLIAFERYVHQVRSYIASVNKAKADKHE